MWLTAVTVWLFSREGVAKSPCRCGSDSGIYNTRKKKKSIDEMAKNLPVEEVLLLKLPESQLVCEKCGGAFKPC